MSKLKKSICVTTQFVGFHKWDKAPKIVSWLRNFHRHIFYVKAYFEVSHNDRDLEFFMVQRALDKFMAKNIYLADVGSCESVAETILEEFKPQAYKVEVWEDKENGAIIERS